MTTPVTRRTAAAMIGATLALPAASAPSGRPVIVGRTGAYQGSAAPLGNEQVAGAKACFSAVNAEGGVRGRSIELRELDDDFDPARARANAQQFAAEGVLALFLGQGTLQTLSALEGLAGTGVPVIAPYTGARTVYRHPYPLLFRFRASYDDEIAALVHHFSTVGWKRVAVLRLDNLLGESLEQSARATVAAEGGALAGIVSVRQDGGDVVHAAAVTAKLDADIVLIASFGDGAVSFIREYRKTAGRAQLAALSLLTKKQITDLGRDAVGLMASQVMPLPTERKIPLVRDFLRDMETHAPTNPKTYLSLEGYAAARWLCQAIARTTSLDSRAALAQSIKAIDDWDLGGLRLHSPTTRASASDFVDIVIVDARLQFRK